MKILPGPRQKIFVKIFGRRWPLRKLLLHDGDQVRIDLVNFITSKEIGHLSGRQNIVDILQETLVLDLLVGENERYAFALLARHSIKYLYEWQTNNKVRKS